MRFEPTSTITCYVFDSDNFTQTYILKLCSISELNLQ